MAEKKDPPNDSANTEKSPDKKDGSHSASGNSKQSKSDSRVKAETHKSPSGGEVTSIVKCMSKECKRPPQRLGFCDEHYRWFKEGLITRQGLNAQDFDKKMRAFMRRQAA